jgi:hypothetical protein
MPEFIKPVDSTKFDLIGTATPNGEFMPFPNREQNLQIVEINNQSTMTPSSSLEEGESSSADVTIPAGSSPSLSSAMAKGAAVMKEEDAALLERGVRDSCSSGVTPILAPIAHPSIRDLSPLASPSETSENLSNRCESAKKKVTRKHEEFYFRPHETSLATRCSPACAPEEVEQGSEAVSNLHQSESGATKEKEKYLYRQCLSGDVRPQSSILDSDSSHNGSQEDLISISPVSVAGEVRPSNPNSAPEERNFNEPASTSGFAARSKSHDRRLSEAMQFAEAVGEMPRAEAIIEETESDDDSDMEVHVDDPPLPSDESASVPSAKNISLADVVNKESTTSVRSAEETLLFSPVAPRRRHKSRPSWPILSSPQQSSAFLHKLPGGVNIQNFVYKGICSNPPEITKLGISRGNYAQLHRKAWLEVSDKYHRYGKNLRLYYKYWESCGFPTNQFFDWLDSKGEAAGQPLPNLDECPRSQLDADTVHYIINPDVTQGYSMTITPDEQGRGMVRDVDGDPVLTGPEGWIFVLRDHTLYGGEKIASISGHSKQRFHHSSFFGGKAVAAAGIIITNEDGMLRHLYPHSGHYRPGEADMQRMLFHLHDSGVDLGSFEMDTQQILHVSRYDPPGKVNNEEGEKKKKKIQSLHLKRAVYVACFLAHKARFIGAGIFDQIHTIRKASVTSVTEVLEACDDGGFWAKIRRERAGKRKGGPCYQ